MTVSKGPRTVTELVEEQFQRWQRGSQGTEPPAEPRPRPIVTISRTHASGGVEFARLLAERLGFTFWHKELVREIATNAHLSERLIAAMDEHRRDRVAEVVRNLTLVDSAASSAPYIVALIKALRGIAALGGAVIVGRGAQYVLDPGELFRVRLVAPLEQRIEQLVGQGRSSADASKEIAAIDADRRGFIKGYFKHDPEDALEYDLTINLGTIPRDTAADLVITAMKAHFAGRM